MLNKFSCKSSTFFFFELFLKNGYDLNIWKGVGESIPEGQDGENKGPESRKVPKFGSKGEFSLYSLGICH